MGDDGAKIGLVQLIEEAVFQREEKTRLRFGQACVLLLFKRGWEPPALRRFARAELKLLLDLDGHHEGICRHD
jgi:hypothetical protein